MQVGIDKDFQILQTQVSNINRNAQKILEKWKFGNLILLITNINYDSVPVWHIAFIKLPIPEK